MFYIMNIGTSLTVVFVAASWFVRRIKREKEHSDKLGSRLQYLFGQHVSREVADELIMDDGISEGSTFYDATVMFADIRDFTAFAESRAPKEVGNFQNIVFGEFINIVRANRGIVLQALGDGIMAVFGAPVAHETHAYDAVQAGHQMLKKVKSLFEQGEIPATRLGIGLHSGQLIAGAVGNDIRKFYTLSGRNVIIAARIEQFNKNLQSQFLLSDSTFERVDKRDLPFTFHGKKKLKGISEPIGIYQLA